MYKILICEDHEIVVEGVKMMLASQDEFMLCGHVTTYAQLQPFLQHENPSVLLLDLNLKKEDGYTILIKLKENYPHVKVLILTMYEEAYLIEKARKLGANGFLLKNMAHGELVEALRHVFNSEEFYLQSNLKTQQQQEIVLRDQFVEKMHLTPREIDIIRLVAMGKSAKEIGDELFLSIHTVDTHRRNIIDKLKLKNIADLARFAVENHLL
ncbi:MAG: response regulator transcription factor [Bacteroidetes bacterium]|nr:response regulator transcription factor [Bacteroidota bacterium]